MEFQRTQVNYGRFHKEGGKGNARMCYWADQCYGSLVLSTKGPSEELYEMHLRAACLLDGMGMCLFIVFHRYQARWPHRYKCLSILGCVSMNPKQVSAGIPCCSVRETMVGMEGSTLQPQARPSNCICVKLVESCVDLVVAAVPGIRCDWENVKCVREVPKTVHPLHHYSALLCPDKNSPLLKSPPKG